MDATTQRIMRSQAGRIAALQTQHSGVITRPLAGSSFPWELFCLGFRIIGTSVTIIGGEAQFGTLAHIIAETTVPIAYDMTYVGVWWTRTSAGVLPPGTDVLNFRPDADTGRRWLYRFRLSNESVSLDICGHFNIMATGMGAPA